MGQRQDGGRVGHAGRRCAGRASAALLVDGRAVAFDEADIAALAGQPALAVIVDRIVRRAPRRLSRLTDSIETAYHEGGGAAFAIEVGAGGDLFAATCFPSASSAARAASRTRTRSRGSSRSTTRTGRARPATASATSSKSTWTSWCPIPRSRSAQNAIEPWSKPHYRSHLADLKRAARTAGVRLDVPWRDLRDDERRVVVEGDGADYEGIRGFFQWLEKKKYKVHVRVFLSRYRGYLTCPDCRGTRLRREARDVRVGGRTIDAVCRLTVTEAQRVFEALGLSEKETIIAEKLLREIRRRLAFLSDVGLDYLTLDRLSSTLSGGESQRISLATSLGSALVGTLYVLDEPSIGLHPRDNQRLIDILRQLRDQGNTVLVVEHDAEMIRVADHIVDLGLGAGEQGGRVIFSGNLDGSAARAAIAHGQVPARRAVDPRAVDAHARQRAAHPADRRAGAQPPRHRRGHPAEHADGDYRRERVGQVDARARHPLPGDQAPEGQRRRSGSARTARSRARSSSPTPCWSIRRRSGDRRDRTRSRI